MHVWIANPWWRGERSRHPRRIGNPQFYLSGKRPIEDKRVHGFHGEGRQLPLVNRCWEMIKSTIMFFLFFVKWFSTKRINITIKINKFWNINDTVFFENLGKRHHFGDAMWRTKTLVTLLVALSCLNFVLIIYSWNKVKIAQPEELMKGLDSENFNVGEYLLN